MDTAPGPSTPPPTTGVRVAASSAKPPAAATLQPWASSGVYVHVPFCRRRCPYCDFAFEVRPADARFAGAVVDEIAARRAELPHPPVTLSFGGGTPSALPVADIARIVAAAGAAAEISLELNPEDVDVPYARALRDLGVHRVSLGVQSFDDALLRWLGRAHDGARARAAVAACVDAGLRTGIDLIVGVPGEDARVRDVDEAVRLGVGHVSAYLLTVEEGTPLVQLISSKARASVDDDAQADAYAHLQRTLTERGFAQYEVSSYARPGEESVHNRLYWSGSAYLGVGPSASSMIPLPDGRVRRRRTLARFDAWVLDPIGAEHEVETLGARHAFLESVAFGLRDLAAGVDVRALALRHCVDDDGAVAAVLARAARDGHVEWRSGRAHLTRLGARFADRVARGVLALADVDERR